MIGGVGEMTEPFLGEILEESAGLVGRGAEGAGGLHELAGGDGAAVAGDEGDSGEDALGGRVGEKIGVNAFGFFGEPIDEFYGGGDGVGVEEFAGLVGWRGELEDHGE